jgi:ABC-type transport system substrate-binding protein
VYLVINSTKPELRDIRLRQAISLAVDRSAIHNVIFQRQGEVAGGLLPNWLTGYSFLFSTTPDLARAKQLRSEAGQVPAITVAYDISDPLERLIAERVALNAREAGITMQAIASNGTPADIRLRRVTVGSADPSVALNGIIEELGIMPPPSSPTLDALYTYERAAVQTFMAIPLVHLPKIAAMKDRVRNWTSSPLGEWSAENLWTTPRTAVREGRP